MAKERDIFSDSFTGEYADLAGVVRNGRAKLNEIDRKIEALPKSPQPTLTTTSGRDNNFSEETRRQLLAEKATVQQTVGSHVYSRTDSASPEVRDNLLAKSAFLMDQKNTFVDSPNQKDQRSQEQAFEKMNFQREDVQNNNKLKASESFKQRLNSNDQDLQQPNATSPKKTISEPAKASERFNKDLSSNDEITQAQERPEPEIPKTEMSGSDRFDLLLVSSTEEKTEEPDKTLDNKDKTAPEPPEPEEPS